MVDVDAEEDAASDGEPGTIQPERHRRHRNVHDNSARASKAAKQKAEALNTDLSGASDEDDEDDEDESTPRERSGRSDEESVNGEHEFKSAAAPNNAAGDEDDDDEEDNEQGGVHFDPRTGQAFIHGYSLETGGEVLLTTAVTCDRICYPFPAVEFTADELRKFSEFESKDKLGVPCPGCPNARFNDTKVMAFKKSSTTNPQSIDYGKNVPVLSCNLHNES